MHTKTKFFYLVLVFFWSISQTVLALDVSVLASVGTITSTTSTPTSTPPSGGGGGGGGSITNFNPFNPNTINTDKPSTQDPTPNSGGGFEINFDPKEGNEAFYKFGDTFVWATSGKDSFSLSGKVSVPNVLIVSEIYNKDFFRASTQSSGEGRFRVVFFNNINKGIYPISLLIIDPNNFGRNKYILGYVVVDPKNPRAALENLQSGKIPKLPTREEIINKNIPAEILVTFPEEQKSVQKSSKIDLKINLFKNPKIKQTITLPLDFQIKNKLGKTIFEQTEKIDLNSPGLKLVKSFFLSNQTESGKYTLITRLKSDGGDIFFENTFTVAEKINLFAGEAFDLKNIIDIKIKILLTLSATLSVFLFLERRPLLKAKIISIFKKD